MNVDTLIEKLDFLDPEDETYWITLVTGIKALPIEDGVKTLQMIMNEHSDDSTK